MMHVAWIGTGVMGKPMALHLADAGYQVTCFNRTYSKAFQLEPKAQAVNSIQECVQNADIVFSIVGYPSDVKDTYEEVFKYAKKGTIFVDMTTSSPTLAIELEKKAKDLGFIMLDAPVTGGDLGAINATLSIMVGGDEKTYQIIYPLLEKMGKTITYMGKPGSGQHAKLANQTAIAGAIAGVAEAMMYAKDKDLDPFLMLKVITGGSASSWQAQNNGPKMMKHDYAPGFYIKHYLKDLRLVLEEKNDLALPVVEQVTKAYQYLHDHGFKEEGTQAIIEYYLRQMM
ncbi:MAG: NAD(P)-dependent oxidoreductase [Acholeplasma sp.]|jgi:3-hydroxyisobutyrate dehydrogenase|nr:MAG: NAD(P)-dependent oxidoreductase [Acholeplasma sp.]